MAAQLLVVGSADAGDRWSSPRTLSSDAAGAARVVGNDRGDAIAAWAGIDGGIHVSAARRGGGFGPPRRIAGSDFETYPDDLDLEIDEQGDAVIAGEDCVEVSDPGPDEGCRELVYGAAKHRAGGWRRARLLSSTCCSHSVTDVAVSSHGAWVAYGDGPPSARSTDPSFRFRKRTLQLGGYDSSAGFVTISSRGTLFQWLQSTSAGYSIDGKTLSRGSFGKRSNYANGPLFEDLLIEGARDGSQAAVWNDDTSDEGAKLATRKPGHRFGHVRGLGGPGFSINLTDLATARGGGSIAALATVNANSIRPRRLRVAIARPGGSFGRPWGLRFKAERSPRVAVGSHGVAAMTWLGLDDRTIHTALWRGFGRPRRFDVLTSLRDDRDDCSTQTSIRCPLPDVAVGGGVVLAIWVEGTRVKVARFG
jgi:hypothetical protein